MLWVLKITVSLMRKYLQFYAEKIVNLDLQCMIEYSMGSLHIIFSIRRSTGVGCGSEPRLENHKNIGIFSNTVPDPLENHKATKPAFIVGLSLAH